MIEGALNDRNNILLPMYYYTVLSGYEQYLLGKSRIKSAMRPGLLILRYLNSHQNIKNLLEKQEMPNDVCVSVELRVS